MRTSIILSFLLLTIYNCSAQRNLMKDFDLGSYTVGFKHEVATDFSRIYGDHFRPIELFIWYPSGDTLISSMKYIDYYISRDEKVLSAITLDSLISVEIANNEIKGDSKALLHVFKDLTTIAQKESAITDGFFPLILFAPGGNTPGRLHFMMCEYLASHGYIVVNTPSLGNADIIGWPFDQTGLNLQIEDMSFVINYVGQNIRQVDISKIGLFSWSVGGVSQAILSMKNSGVDAFISIDSGIGRTYGIEMLKESIHFDYGKFNVPYLHITGAQPEIYAVERSTEFYDSIPSLNKYLKLQEEFAHHHFVSTSIIASVLSGDEHLLKGYINMSQTTRIFVDAFLKQIPKASQQWLKMNQE